MSEIELQQRRDALLIRRGVNLDKHSMGVQGKVFGRLKALKVLTISGSK